MDILALLTALCVSGSVTCLLLFFLELVTSVTVEKQKEEVKELPIHLRMFMPLTGNLRFITQNEAFKDSNQRGDERIVMAGYEGVIAGEQFLALRFIAGFFGVVMCVLAAVAGNPVFGLIILALMIIYPPLWLKKTIEARHRSIQKALPNVLDLLTLSVEAGKDFLTSLRDILTRRKRDPLGEELERTFHEIQLGKKRTQALKDLVTRVKQPDLSSVMNSIIQSDDLGVSIAQLLRIQGDQLRMKRFQRAEQLANEAPVKIIFPIALFIVPAVMAIMGGPLVIQLMQTMFK
ncbi:MAG: type II secretion system F family protein [Kiritimatiellaeota bacterium]|nr:type II secretion system F family protein [Kiritimatiellota bacterium]